VTSLALGSFVRHDVAATGSRSPARRASAGSSSDQVALRATHHKTIAMTTPVLPKAKVCFSCRDVIDATAVVCPRCGTPQPTATLVGVSERRILPALLLCFFLGVFGAHRFYVGKIGTGILELLTLGGFGIWWLVDMILILTGTFRDGDGQKITEWT